MIQVHRTHEWTAVGRMERWIRRVMGQDLQVGLDLGGGGLEEDGGSTR